MAFQNPSNESRAAMGQILSSDVPVSSPTSIVAESTSLSQNPAEQIPKEEPLDQLKKNGRGEADQLNEPSDQSKKNGGGEADQLKNNGGEPDQSRDRDAEAEPGKEEGEEEEEGECGFCLFMKGGGCRDSFTEWEKCMEEAEKKEQDVVEKCFQITSNLKKCMEAHADYYDPILRAEKAAEEEVAKELDQMKGEQRIAAQDSSTNTMEEDRAN